MGQSKAHGDDEGELESALVAEVHQADQDATLEAVQAQEAGEAGGAKGKQPGERRSATMDKVFRSNLLFCLGQMVMISVLLPLPEYGQQFLNRCL